MAEKVIGVVGLGTMGSRVAAHLARTGSTVVGFDLLRSEPSLEGVEVCSSLTEIGQRADVAVLSLPDGAAVIQSAAELVGRSDRQVAVVIDLSTIGVEAAETVATILDGGGVGYVDAPVSGSLEAAATGRLSVMVSGAPVTVDRARDVLEQIGTIAYLGERPGLGQLMKVINNAISGTTLAVTCEALALGVDRGLDLTQMIEVINRSSGRSVASEVKIPEQVLTGAYAHGGPGSHFAKDIGLFVEAAREAGLWPRLAAESASLWQRFSIDWPGADQTEIYPYLQGADRPSRTP